MAVRTLGGDLQRRRLQLRKGRIGRKALLPCLGVICCRQLLPILCIIHLKTTKKHIFESDAEHANQENEFDLLHVSLGVKKRKRQENRVVSERFPLRFTAEAALSLRDPGGESSTGWILLQSAATHREANFA